MRNLLWLAVAASSRGLPVPAATREAVGGAAESAQKAAKESAAEPESSPESPLEQDEPPHEDEEQPVVITR